MRETSKQRAKRYCAELHERKHLSGKRKGRPLSGSEAGFRMGVINQRNRQGIAASKAKK